VFVNCPLKIEVKALDKHKGSEVHAELPRGGSLRKRLEVVSQGRSDLHVALQNNSHQLAKFAKRHFQRLQEPQGVSYAQEEIC